MGETKQLKVDNWGTFLLQNLKNFFNRTDYCDLTLQFQDNAQLKVHRLVLNACTEYFELLERTCEMYEDCLIMPDDLQADVVVPIVNFMYTGQLEYKNELLNRLYQTAQMMNITILTKLLDAHRYQPRPPKPTPPKYKQLNNQSNYSRSIQSIPKRAQPSTSQKKVYVPSQKEPIVHSTRGVYSNPISRPQPQQKKRKELPARPTRYELPEELDKDDIFESSFTELSYESKPLMTHPMNEYSKSVSGSEGPSSYRKLEDFRKIVKRPAITTEEIEFKRIKSGQSSSIFSETEEYGSSQDHLDELFETVERSHQTQNTSQQFDHVIEMEGAKVTIQTKTGNEKPIDHAKIISEVLKKYPHLVKNNKNIKLKIVSNPNKSESKSSVRRGSPQVKSTASPILVNRQIKKEKERDFSYETDIIDTKEVGRLISLGVENVKGPWLCLICGTPGKALNFTTYHKFRTHLVEVHNERPPSNMCEFCGLKSGKRNHLLHHIYTQHGVPPPPSYHFPKCNQCPYVALTQAFLVKHKMSHSDVRSFTCNVCQCTFRSTTQLLQHIQKTGHKICPDRKSNLQCIYCMKTFLRESNLYAHLKASHKSLARNDGIIDNSDEDDTYIKPEPHVEEEIEDQTDEEEEEEEMEENEGQYQIHEELGNIQIINKKNIIKSPNQKILNQSLLNSTTFTHTKRKTQSLNVPKIHHNVNQLQENEPSILTDEFNERIVVLNQNEYIMKGQSVQVASHSSENEYIISDIIDTESGNPQNVNISIPPTHLPQVMSNVAMEDARIQQKGQQTQLNNKTSTINQPYQIVLSSEQEYKALMAANPSIIFQDGTAGKAMAVMSHGPEIQAQNIEVDTTQNSNMMIIQNDYPINVSEALTGDNSSIVVVYSHNIDSQGVQYSEQQLVTSQSIQGQLVPTSQVITSIGGNTIQPTMIVEQQVEQWQSAQQQVVVTALEGAEPLVPDISLQKNCKEVPPADQLVSSPTVVDKSLTEETELQIIRQPEDATSEVIISQPSEEMQDNEIVTHNVPAFNPDVEQEHMVCEQEVAEPVIADNLEEHVVLPADQNDTAMEVENQENTTLYVEEQAVEIQSNDEITEASIESENSQDLPESNSVTVSQSPPEIVIERIRNLTADWSDDESSKIPDDVTPAPASTTAEADASLPAQVMALVENAEVEESIENIKEEMKNQLISTPSKRRIIITSDITLPTGAALITKSRSVSLEATESNAEISKQNPNENNKISSLLNDWEDNNSQTESNGTTSEEKTISIEMEPEPESEIPTDNTTIVDDAVQPKAEKAKSLEKIMSDWDEEEEEKED